MGWGLCRVRAPLHRSRRLAANWGPLRPGSCKKAWLVALATTTVVWQAHPGRLGQGRCWLAAPLIIRDMSLGL